MRSVLISLFNHLAQRAIQRQARVRNSWRARQTRTRVESHSRNSVSARGLNIFMEFPSGRSRFVSCVSGVAREASTMLRAPPAFGDSTGKVILPRAEVNATLKGWKLTRRHCQRERVHMMTSDLDLQMSSIWQWWPASIPLAPTARPSARMSVRSPGTRWSFWRS